MLDLDCLFQLFARHLFSVNTTEGSKGYIWQGSLKGFDRARLNFQAFPLRDMKWRPEKADA